jgi:hypothetical protein
MKCENFQILILSFSFKTNPKPKSILIALDDKNSSDLLIQLKNKEMEIQHMHWTLNLQDLVLIRKPNVKFIYHRHYIVINRMKS